ISLDAQVNDDATTTYNEIIADDSVITADEQLETSTLTTALTGLLEKLNPREATILRYRFGLDGGNERTLEEVGQKYGVTRERIRQLQNIALLKLRKM